MPLVTGNFSDVAERVNKQFWYDHTQNSLKVTNSGSFPIIVEVSDNIRVIPAGENYTFDEEFKTFFVRCKTKNTDSSAFSVETTSYKTNGMLLKYVQADGNVLEIRLGEEGIVQYGNTGAKGLRNIAISNTAPTSPALNDLWIDTNS